MTTGCAWLAASLVSSFGSETPAEGVQFASPERLDVPGLTQLEGPEVVDFDGDGVRDLLSGVYAGNLLFRKNTGTNKKPEYAEPVKLKRGGEDIKLKHW